MDPPPAILDNAQLTTAVLNTNNQLGQLSAILQSIHDQLRIASNESASADPNSSGPSPYPFNSHRPHLSAKLPPPPLFDGRKPERLGSWLFRMSQYLVMSGYNVNTPEAITFAAICLQGTLATWWENTCRQTSSSYAGFPHWAAFCTALFTYLCPPDARPRAMEKMRELQQGRDPVHVFVAKFLALLADIPDWSEQTEFKAKANPDLAVSFALMTPQPTTLEEHIRLLTVFEQQQKEQRLQQKNFLKQANSRSHNSYNHRDYSSTRVEPSTFAPMDIGTIRHRIMTLLEDTKTRHTRPDTPRPCRSSDSSRSRSPSASHASSSRHTTPDKSKDRLANTSTRRSPLTDEERDSLRANDGCLYCRKPHAGHIAKNCPHRRNK